MMTQLRRKLDDDIPELTEPLLGHLLPIANRIQPSMAVTHHVSHITVRLTQTGNLDPQPFHGKLSSRWQQNWSSVWPESDSPAPNTRVKVIPHHPVWMPVAERARLSISGSMTLGERPILGNEVEDANYCMRIEMSTEDAGEVKGWMPHGQLRRDVFELLKTYLGCDYDASLYLTVQVRLLPRPRLGDPDLFSGYNIMLGLRDDNEDQMPQTMRMRVGKLRGRDFDEE